MKKINLPIAAKDGQEINLSNRHIGSIGFFRPFINYCLESVAKDKLGAKIRTFVQGFPLAGPNLGQFTSSLHAFFVPFRTVFSDWNNFLTGLECRYYGTDTHHVNEGDSYGSNTSRMYIGKRKYVPLISRTDIFYLFFSELRPFDPSYYEDSQSLTSRNYLNISDDYTNDYVSYSSSPFVVYYIIGANSDDITDFSVTHDIIRDGKTYVYAGSKPDVVGSVFVSNAPNSYPKSLKIGIYFTPYGRLIYQLLRCLGYKRTFGGYFRISSEAPSDPTFPNNYQLTADYYTENRDHDSGTVNMFSALKLLSLYKIFVDWYIPSKFNNNYDMMLQTMSMLQYPFREQSGFDDFHLTRPYPLLSEILLYTSYPNDYFTNAFLYPNGSNDGDMENIVLSDITSPDVSVYNRAMQDPSSSDTRNTPYLGHDGGDTYTVPLTQYALRALRALNNYVRRNQIVGFRAVDRMLAHYGVKLDYTQTNRSVCIASHENDFFPESVMSQTDSHTETEPSPESQQALLGGRAANLLFGNDIEFDFEADEVGVYMVINSVYPKIGYVQGIERDILHLSKDDFYTPEFDSLGVQPILVDELYGEQELAHENNSGAIFGYSQRYAEYKYKQDDLSGDFVLQSRNSFLESLHTFRLFDKDNIPLSINNKFLIGSETEYNRIFAMFTDLYDHLQIASYNDVKLQRHVDSAADVNDITDGSGQTMQVAVGGNHQLR